MNLRKHGATLFQGFVVVAPILITAYVVVKALGGLDSMVRRGLEYIGVTPLPGVGIVIGLGVIYMVGLLARIWFFGALVRVGEGLLERIPLVKTVYSAIRDLLQFISGSKRGGAKPAMVTPPGGNVALLGLITQERPGTFMPGAEDKVAVYLPMSYQIGGFTMYVPRDAVQELPDLSVEDLLKLCLTAGIGASGANGEQGAAGSPAQQPGPASSP
jgi:uncharacterized membrane protein